MTPDFELLHYHATPRSVAAARVIVFGLWACLAIATPLADLAQLPSELALPTGVVSFMPTAWKKVLWTPTSLDVIRWITCVASLACVFGWRGVRAAGPIACVAATLFQCAVRGYGHINHGEVAALLAMYSLVAFSWINGKARVERWESRGLNPHTAPLLAIAVVICLSYTMIGLHRLALESLHLGGEGRAFFTDALARWTIGNSYGEGSYAFAMGIGAIAARSFVFDFLSNAGFVVVTLVESTAMLCLVSSRYRALFLVVMVSFHIGSLFLMRIFFWENLFLYLFLINWSQRPIKL